MKDTTSGRKTARGLGSSRKAASKRVEGRCSEMEGDAERQRQVLNRFVEGLGELDKDVTVTTGGEVMANFDVGK